MKKRFTIFLIALCLTLQPFMAFAAKVYQLDCDADGCSDSIESVAVSAAVASTRIRTNASGLLESVAADTVRTDYQDSKWWMMSEGMGVNLVTYAYDLSQGVWAKNNMTAAMTETGADGSPLNASLITATDANATILFTTTSPNGAHTGSFYLKRVTGTGAVSVTVNNGSTWTAKTITSSWARYTETQTTANPVIGIKLATSGDQVAVDFVQCETGSYATSPISTNGAIGIRASEEGAVDTTDLYTGANLTVDAINFADGSAAADFTAVNLDEYVATGDKYRIRLADDEGDEAVGFIGADDPANAGGCLIYSTKDGTTQNWASKAVGFNDADTEYTITAIEFVETNGYYQANASLWGGDGWDAGTDMDTAGTMVVDWWPLTAQSTYDAVAKGLVGIADTVESIIGLASSDRLVTLDSTKDNVFQSDWTTSAVYKAVVTWATGGSMDLYQNSIKSTDADKAFDGAYALGTNLVFFFDNHMPTRLSGLTFYNTTAADYVAQTSGNDGEINYTEVAPAALSVRGIHVQAGHTGTLIQNVTAAGDNILSCLICLEEDATVTNTVGYTEGSAASLMVATTKTASGSNNYFSDAVVSGAGDEDFTSETWSGVDPFVNYAMGDFRLSPDASFKRSGVTITGIHDTPGSVDIRGRPVYNKPFVSLGAYQGEDIFPPEKVLQLKFPIGIWNP